MFIANSSACLPVTRQQSFVPPPAAKSTTGFQVTAKIHHWSGPQANTHLKKWHCTLLSLKTPSWLELTLIQGKRKEAQKTWVSISIIYVLVNNKRFKRTCTILPSAFQIVLNTIQLEILIWQFDCSHWYLTYPPLCWYNTFMDICFQFSTIFCLQRSF